MKRSLSLDDLELFVAVADAGGLGGAARATGTSAPTLSRRMAELERRAEARLFERGPRGYALTSEGRALLEEAEGLRALAARLARWGSGARSAPRVRITAGSWTARRLARGIGAVWAPGAGWMPEFLASNATVDIARREADIGIRNRRPDQPWLAGRRTGEFPTPSTRPAPRRPGMWRWPKASRPRRRNAGWSRTMGPRSSPPRATPG